jgi:putative transposase
VRGRRPREGDVVNVHGLIAVGANHDGHREILGLDVTSAEDGAGWLAFFRGLTRRVSDASRSALSVRTGGIRVPPGLSTTLSIEAKRS